MNIFKIVQTFASLTQESVLNTLSLSRSFRQCYIENTEMLPVSINPLVDAHFNQRLRETAHSRILYSLLTGSNVVKKHFIKFLLEIYYVYPVIQEFLFFWLVICFSNCCNYWNPSLNFFFISSSFFAV